MADYESKYSGEQVEALLDQVASGNAGGGGGGIAVETDPIFSASPAATITEADKSAWSGKQDAISDLATIRSGAAKGATALQSIPEEYVTEEQLIWTKVEGEAGVRLKGTNGTATGNLAISAGDDKKASDGTQFVSAASGDHSVAFGYGNTCAGRSTLAQGLYNTVNGKDSVAFGQRNLVGGDQAFAVGQQNEVTTRLGVAIGYKNKATNTDSIAIGYQNTSGGSASVAMGDTCEANGTSATAMGYKTKATGSYSSTFGQETQTTNSGEVAMGVYNKSTTSTDTSEQTSFSFGIGTSDTNRINALEIKKNGDVYIGDKLLSVEDFMTAEDLAAVATSGSYNDLTDKPTIPSAVTESTVSGWGFTKTTGTYSKPSGGIPKSDLASDVQASLSNADNAVQKDMVGALNIINVEGVYDDDYVYALPTAAAKNVDEDYDDIILSRGSVKTINGESIFGSGDITIAGGSGEKGDKGDKGDTGVGVQSVKQTTISNTDGGSNVVTVTLSNGTTSTFTVKNGSKGSSGTNGTNGKDGKDGATFTPSVDSAGNLSWTNNKGLANPPTVNIKGPKGDAGSGGGGVSEEYVNNAIANAITNVINADY